MDVQINRLRKIKAENAHDRLCIDDITAGNKVKIKIKTIDVIYECFTLSIELRETLIVFIGNNLYNGWLHNFPDVFILY